MSRDKKIFLFDMDGTLTPVRGQVQKNMVNSLKELSRFGRIGVVTGSGFEYVWEQMSRAFEVDGIPTSSIDILPCNGTKKYTANQAGSFFLEYEDNMLDKIGQESYNNILRLCVEWQRQIMESFPGLPYTGTFLQYRGSLLNWCPIGRNADTESRNAWVDLDKKQSVRSKYSMLMLEKMSLLGIDVTAALGGSTSLDIYPTGWDKTYCLKHYPGHEAYFVGDKCEKGGNDWHLFERLKEQNRSYSVKGPEDTMIVINKLMTNCS